MRAPTTALLLLPALLLSSAPHAQIQTQTQTLHPLERLPTEQFAVTPPSARVTGEPGNMRIIERGCPALPTADLRQRIVDIAVQEWAYFGRSVDQQLASAAEFSRMRSRFARMGAAESARVASSIAGYWAATPDSDWIVRQQNSRWQAEGVGTRWRDAWSAAFISWVMCESGLSNGQFRRAIAHHTYIDQAIRALDDDDPDSLFVARTPGTARVSPGDLLCRGSRPAYRSIAERRNQMGVGARTHCDIVVKVDTEQQQIQVIGGNVRGWVRMKVLHAQPGNSGFLYAPADNGRALFAHLQLNLPPAADDAFDVSPTMVALRCDADSDPLPVALETTASC